MPGGMALNLDMEPSSGRGILSQTIAVSPEVRFVVPITFQTTYDQKSIIIAMIYDRSIDWKQISSRGSLTSIEKGPRFCSRIRAAKALGKSNLGSEASVQAQFDTLIKQEGKLISNDDTYNSVYPAILVLVLDSRELAFVRISLDSPGTVSFSIVYRPLPNGSGNFLEEFGKSLAVSPDSSAMAVAAFVGKLTIYSTIPAESIDQASAMPICEELTLRSDCSLLGMEFLYTGPQDERVHLLAIGSKRGKLRMLKISWDPSTMLTPGNVKLDEESFPKSQGIPSIIIPLITPGCFALIDERTFAVYEGGLSNKFELTYQSRLDQDMEPDILPPLSSNSALWVGWNSLQCRDSGNSRWDDLVYLVREDGLLSWLRLYAAQNRRTAVVSRGSFGALDCRLDTAFTFLNFPFEARQYILAAGNNSKGGIYQIVNNNALYEGKSDDNSPGPVSSLLKLDTIANWVPLNDFVQANTIVGRHGQSNDSHRLDFNAGRCKLYAACGKGTSGSLSELRYGLESRIYANFENEDFVGVQNVWVLSRARNKSNTSDFEDNFQHESTTGIIFVLALPEYNISISCEASEPEVFDLGEDHILTMMNFEPNFRPKDFEDSEFPLDCSVVQVTTESVNILRLDSTPPFLHANTRLSWPLQQAIMASIEPQHGFVLIIQKIDEKYRLQLKQIISQGNELAIQDIGRLIAVDFEPTCISFFHLPGVFQSSDTGSGLDKLQPGAFDLFTAIGTIDGEVQIFSVNDSTGLSSALVHALTDRIEVSLGAACESIAILKCRTKKDGQTMATLLCGSRDGKLHAAAVVPSSRPGDVEIIDKITIEIGNTPLQVKTRGRSNFAMIYCGTTMCQVEFCGFPLRDNRILNIWISDTTEPTYAQHPILAVGQIQTRDDDLVCISGPNFLILRMEQQARLLPRQYPLPGIPNRLLYSKHLGCFVIGSTTMHLVLDSPRQRMLQSSLLLVRPDSIELTDTQSTLHENATGILASFSGTRPGEKFTCLMELFCENDDEKYHRLVAASETRHVDGQKSGIIRYFDVSSDYQIRLVKEKLQKEPVYAISQYGKAGLVFSCGLELTYQTFSFEEKRFLTICTYSLRSPAIHIASRSPYIFVTTANDSVAVFCIDSNAIKFVNCDSLPRAGLYHMDIPSQRLLMFTDKFGCVAGLSHDRTQDFDGTSIDTSPILFEAQMPCSIMRLLKADIRPLWKQQQLDGVIERDIIGAGTDGSLFNFTVLNQDTWRLLKFIQNMCERNPEICNGGQQRLVKKSHLEPRGKKAADFHVDGDILERLLRCASPTRTLDEMLDEGPRNEGDLGHQVDFDTVDARRKRFTELISNVLDGSAWPACFSEAPPKGEQTLSPSYSAVQAILYLRQLLERPL